MKSPLRYPGGKSRLAKKILDYIPENVTVASPFFGGGSVELALMSRNQCVLGNDAFSPLANFWLTAFFGNKGRLIERCQIALSNTPDQKRQLFISSRVALQSPDHYSSSYSAFAYFFVNRCSFSGATLSGGYSESAAEFRFTKSSIDRLALIGKLSTKIDGFDCLDFRAFLRNRSGLFLYLDPPYYEIDGLYGNNGDMGLGYEDHQDLAEILKNHGNGWALSYNDCPQIRELYKGFEFIELKPSLSMSNGKKSCPEVLILNRSGV
jgi:DNA adenine methylase